jgi:hypothetical protein
MMTHLPPLIGGLHLSKREAHSPALRHSRYARFPLRGIGIPSSRESESVLQPSHSHDSLLKGDTYRTISKPNPLRGLKFGKISSHICMCLESLNRIAKFLFKDLLKVIPYGNKGLVCYHIGITFSSKMKKDYTMITNTITQPMMKSRVVQQAIRTLTMFGVPTEVATKAVRNVVSTVALPKDLNTATHSECQTEPNNGGI